MDRSQKYIIIRIAASAVLLVAASLVTHFFEFDTWIKILIFSLPYLAVGYDVLFSAMRNIIHGQVFDEQFLMSVATLGAFALGEYPEAVFVMLFYQIGELFQSIAVGKSRRSIAALMEMCPESARVLRDGEEIEVSPDEVSVGEIIALRPGERVPLDGEIIEGSTEIDTAALTGESQPVFKAVGDRIVSGSVNLSGAVKVRVESEFSESTVARILELVESSAEKKTRYENFITGFARYYTPAVVLSAIVLCLVPPFVFGQDFFIWLHRALTFLVISCPCALVVSVPMSFFCGLGSASKQGILIKGSNYIEALSKVNTFVFDKTGTLTTGKFKVSKIKALNIEENELLALAAAAESRSNHPIAESIIGANGAKLVKIPERVTELAGFGVEAEIGGEVYFVGNTRLMSKIGHKAEKGPGTQVHVAKKEKYLGYILLEDEIKSEAKEVVCGLKNIGIEKTVILSGDNATAAETVCRSVGADEVKAELLPGDKVGEVEKLLSEKKKVAFVGDGINDAPVLARADVGFAMGALGSDAAIESADIVLMDDKLSKLPLAVRIAKKTMRIVKQNIWFILVVKAVILLLGALGIANMWIAIFGDVGVMVIAVLNSMRAMKN